MQFYQVLPAFIFKQFYWTKHYLIASPKRVHVSLLNER